MKHEKVEENSNEKENNLKKVFGMTVVDIVLMWLQYV